jgi:hypothetical protein
VEKDWTGVSELAHLHDWHLMMSVICILAGAFTRRHCAWLNGYILEELSSQKREL